MESGIRISSKSKLRNNRKKNKEKKEISIQKAFYLNDCNILIHFSNGVQKIINFLPLFSDYVKGDFQKYFQPSLFKKFIIANGNIYWGKNEDVIFPVSFLYDYPHGSVIKEEVLYVI